VAEFASYRLCFSTTAFQMAPVGEVTLLLSTLFVIAIAILWVYTLNEVRD